MEFKSKEELLMFLKSLRMIGFGSQGTSYLNKKTGEVYKIFNQFIEDFMDDKIKYTKKELMKFSNIKNKTFLWALDTISVKDEIVGYINSFVNAKPLYKINPLRINLNKFEKCIKNVQEDINILSDNSVLTYDIMYNILYGSRFFVTDFDEFNYSNLETKKLEQINNRNFNYELYYFLIDGYFDEFINDYDNLKKLYQEKDDDILYFINLFRKYLSEYVGKEIITLNDAPKCLNKVKKNMIYQRDYIK